MTPKMPYIHHHYIQYADGLQHDVSIIWDEDVQTGEPIATWGIYYEDAVKLLKMRGEDEIRIHHGQVIRLHVNRN